MQPETAENIINREPVRTSAVGRLNCSEKKPVTGPITAKPNRMIIDLMERTVARVLDEQLLLIRSFKTGVAYPLTA